jgi:hypothetical protein
MDFCTTAPDLNCRRNGGNLSRRPVDSPGMRLAFVILVGCIGKLGLMFKQNLPDMLRDFVGYFPIRRCLSGPQSRDNNPFRNQCIRVTAVRGVRKHSLILSEKIADDFFFLLAHLRNCVGYTKPFAVNCPGAYQPCRQSVIKRLSYPKKRSHGKLCERDDKTEADSPAVIRNHM